MKNYNQLFRQLFMAVTAAVFAASGLLHPLFHRDYGEAVESALFSQNGGSPVQVELATAETPPLPEFVPDFCPVCLGSFVCAALPAFDWRISRPAAEQIKASDAVSGICILLTHQARAPPSLLS